jgi:iron complex outermembrane recepter protein
MRTILSAVVAAYLVLSGSEVGAQAAPEGREINLKIDSKTLADALDQWAAQTGVQFVSPSWDIAKRISVTPLRGRYTARAALEKLLSGTPLTGEWMSDKAVAIREKSLAPPAALQSSQADPKRSPAPVTRLGADSDTAVQSQGSTRVAAAGAAADTPVPTKELPGDDLEEIVVTGTHIRGAVAAGGKVIVISREQIENSGYGRLEDVIETLPQNFKAASDESNTQPNGNTNGASEIQLRGLGPATTLTLVNGRRQAPGGTLGAFTDVSSIPTAAVERIEILVDGASAIYGSDAIGGVANIILRKDFEGAETRVRFGTASGERDEVQASQVFGTGWGTGNILAGYQYSRHEELPATEREYSATNGDLSRFGGTDFRPLLARFQGNPGTIICPPGRTDCVANQPAYAIPAGQDGTNLEPTDLIAGGVNYTDVAAATWLLPRQELHAAFFNLSQSLTERWQLLFDGRFGKRDMDNETGPITRTVQVPATNPFYVNPFGPGAVRVAYDFSRDFGPLTAAATTHTYATGLGLVGELGAQWQIKLDTSYSKEKVVVDLRTMDRVALAAALASADSATAFNVFGDGSHTNPATIEALRQFSTEEGTSSNWYASALVDGPVFDLAGGAARLALGADYRDEGFRSIFDATGAGGATLIDHTDIETARQVSALFTELALPIIGGGGPQRLDVSLAARYEDYSDFGTTIDPKVGIAYMPSPGFRVRGTWGTSFRAPPFYQLDEDFNAVAATDSVVEDPRSPTGSSNVLRIAGNNADLQEETADVWTAGVDWMPLMLPDLTVSLTYYSIEYQDKIEAGSPTLVDEGQWAPLITRNPSQAQIDAICALPGFDGDCTGPFAAILDSRLRNISVVKTSGLDIDISDSIETAHGTWTVGLGGTNVFEFERAITDTAPTLDVLDTLANPLDLRLRGRVAWSGFGWTVGAAVNYADDYHIATDDSTKIDSWTTVDLHVGFRTRRGEGWFDNTRLSLSVVNLLDEQAPFVDQPQPVGYDSTNSSILGRLASFQLLKEW